jgi:bacillithiol biosynthesis cysteine-adding enzyme BshC
VPATSLDSPSTDDSTRIAVDLRAFPGVRPFAADYSYNYSGVSGFFAASPWEPSGWASAIARAQARRRQTDALAAIVAEQQRQRGAPAAAIDAGRRLVDASTVAVVTGQQAGLFGGPLYTVLKAITALKLAARIEREHGIPAVAVFWIEAEDHDWDEVRRCTVTDQSLMPVAIELPARDGSAPARVADIRFDESIVAALDRLDATLPSSEFHGDLISGLRETFAEGAHTSEAFARLLDRVLGDHGLVVYDASDLSAKPLAREVFVRELSTAGETARRAAAAGARLDAQGYYAQVEPAEGSASLFYLEEGARRPIRRHADGFAIADRVVAPGALVAEASAHPERFSPNVLLRPIVQDTLFPTVAYVAGPNELAYLAQLRGVYEHFDVPMPLVYPRASATLVDSAAMRFLTRYNLPFESLQRQDEAALNELLAAQMPESVERAFADASRTVETAMTRVVDVMPALDPTLEGAARTTLGRMQHDLQTLHGKMIQAAKRRDDTLRRQYTRTRALTFPGGQPQERTIGFISFLNQYGPALGERLQQALPLEPGHWVVTI